MFILVLVVNPASVSAMPPEVARASESSFRDLQEELVRAVSERGECLFLDCNVPAAHSADFGREWVTNYTHITHSSSPGGQKVETL